MSLSRLLGFDTQAERYAKQYDPTLGHTSSLRIAEKWVKTTCGYCSVGCGMEIGVRHGVAVKAVAVKRHPPRHSFPVAHHPRRLTDRKSTRLNSSHHRLSRMPSSA